MIKIRSMVSLAVATALLSSAPLAALATDSKDASKSELVVKAKPEVVYNAIIKMRDDSKDTVKEISREGQHACVLEETFDGLPMIGSAKCTYKEMYEPCKRIEYTMVHSDKFKAFEGRWLLTPHENGEFTNLSLSSFVDIDLPVPFAKQLCKMTTMRGVKRRLKEVKTACETSTVSMKNQKSVN